MADQQPENRNLLWTMIAGAVVLLLVIYIFAGAQKPAAPPAVAPAAPAVSAPPAAPTEAAPVAPVSEAPAAIPAAPAPEAAPKPPS